MHLTVGSSRSASQRHCDVVAPMTELNVKLCVPLLPSRNRATSDALAMLHAASEAVSQQQLTTPPVLPPVRLQSPPPTQPSRPSHDLSALLNPMPPSEVMRPPPGFVVGKDGKLRKKRGRKPKPGLSDEQRRQARLLKNRRTAETSRRRKIALMKKLAVERDDAQQLVLNMASLINLLQRRLASEMNVSLHKLLESEPRFRTPEWRKQFAEQHHGAPSCAGSATHCDTPEQSDVSRAPSVAESEEESSSCNAANTNALTSTASTLGEHKCANMDT